eukprot:scaffold9260_cov56-Phaeocystis_antarctica.AAC.2
MAPSCAASLDRARARAHRSNIRSRSPSIAGWVNGNLAVVLVPLARLLDQALEPVAHLIVRWVVVLGVAKRFLELLAIAVEVAHGDLGHHPHALFVGHERRLAVHLEHVPGRSATEAGHLLLLRRAVQGRANLGDGVVGLLAIELDAHDEDRAEHGRRWGRRRGQWGRRGRRGWRWRKLVDGHVRALWRRGRVVGAEAGVVVTALVPVEIADRGRAWRVVVEKPAGFAPAAAIAGWVPVEPEARAVRFVVRRPGGGGALHGVGECCRAA